MTDNVFNKIVKQIKAITNEEYNKLLEESKEMEKDYYRQIKNEKLLNEFLKGN